MLLKDALFLSTSLYIVPISQKAPLGIGFGNGGRRWGIFSIHLAFVYIFAINRNIEPSILGKKQPHSLALGQKGEKVGNSPKGPWGQPESVLGARSIVRASKQRFEALMRSLIHALEHDSLRESDGNSVRNTARRTRRSTDSTRAAHL